MIAANLPPRLRLVLAGRRSPPLPLGRLSVEGRLVRVGMDALALDVAETARMAQELGRPLVPEAADSIVERTEGWPAATYLALRGPAGARDAAPAIRGNDGDLAGYLRQELLDPLDAEDRAWLRRASVLDTLSGPFADTILETTGSLARLRGLEQRNLFIVPLDPGRTTFRFHALFRELLRDELDEREPGMAAAIERRAAVRALEDGQIEEAASYALRSGDLDLLAGICERHVVAYWRRGHDTTVRRWVQPFDQPGVREQRAALAVLCSWLEALVGRSETARRWLAAAERSPDTGPMPDGTPDKGPWLAALRAQLMPDGREGLRRDAELASAGLATAGLFPQLADLAVCLVALTDGDLDAARRAADRGITVALARNASPAYLALAGFSAVAALESGDRRAARSVLDAAIAHIHAAGLEEMGVSGLPFAAAARLARMSGDASAAGGMLVRFDRLRPQLTEAIPVLSVVSRLQAMEAHIAASDLAAARTLLRETDDLLRIQPDLGWLLTAVKRIHARVDVGGTARGDHWTLTSAELRVLAYLPTHLTAREIAERLHVSPHTIKTQMMSIYGKLGVSSRREAVEQAIEARLLDPAVLYTPPSRRA